MHKSRLAALVIDSQVDDIEQASQFWSKALGFDCKPADPDWAEKYTHLDTGDHNVHVLIQKVTHPSRVHLDIETDNIAAEVKRLQKLGATVAKEFPRWTVMLAPSGHYFCVVNPQRDDFATADDVNIW